MMFAYGFSLLSVLFILFKDVIFFMIGKLIIAVADYFKEEELILGKSKDEIIQLLTILGRMIQVFAILDGLVKALPNLMSLFY